MKEPNLWASAPQFGESLTFFIIGFPPSFGAWQCCALSGDVGSDTNTRRLLQWLLSGLVTLQPTQIHLINFYLRKTGHVLAYGFMYFLWFRAFREQVDCGPWRSCLWSLGLCLLYASADEGSQWFYASRGVSVYDVILDMSGAGLAALVTAAVWRPRYRALTVAGILGRQTHRAGIIFA